MIYGSAATGSASPTTAILAPAPIGGWLDQAREHYREYEAPVGSPPEDTVFQSRHPHPKHLLPETNPHAFTSIIPDTRRK